MLFSLAIHHKTGHHQLILVSLSKSSNLNLSYFQDLWVDFRQTEEVFLLTLL